MFATTWPSPHLETAFGNALHFFPQATVERLIGKDATDLPPSNITFEPLIFFFRAVLEKGVFFR